MADRLEREIEDVLSKVEDFEWHRQQRRRRQRRQRLQGLRPRIPFGGRSGLWPAHGRFRRVKPGHVMLGGFFLVAASFSFGPGGVWTWLLFGGVGLFLGAMLWSRRRGPSDPSGPSGGRSRGGWWRDRYITYDEPSRTARPRSGADAGSRAATRLRTGTVWLAPLLAAVVVVAACSSGDGTSPPADGPESTDTQADQSAPPVEAETAEPEEGAQEPPPLEESIDEAPVGNPEPDPPGPPLPYDNAHALSVIEELAVRIGPRVKGTDGERAAGDFLSERFASFGYEVERQRFPITRFEILEAEVRVNGTSIGARVMGGSASGTAEGPLILVPGLGDASDYSALDVRGAVVLVERGVLFFQDKVDIAESEGAAAIIIYNNDGGPFDGFLGAGSTIPALSLDRESGLALREAEGTTAGITIEAGSARAESENIIASVSGGPCRLYVGGHYDSVTNVPGANDNASGTALVLELARAFAESAGVEEVCFVAFGAEEGGGGSDGLEGSRFLVRRLQESGAAAEVRAMLNLDAIGSGTSVRLVGSPSLADMARTLADALDIFVVPGGLPIGTGSDHVNFDAIGVPVIFPTVFGAEIHVPADNFANIDPALVERIGLLAHGILQCLIAQENGEALSGDTCLALVQAAA